MMIFSRRSVIGGGGILCVVAAALMLDCKEERVRNVQIVLGVDNRGSQGFACTNNQPPVCAAFQTCSLRERDRTPECVFQFCRDAGNPRECQEMSTCLRGDAGASTGATPSKCFDAICPTPAPLLLNARTAPNSNRFALHLIVEYVALGGFPGCRVAELASWCASSANRCRVTRRKCLPVEWETTDTAPSAEDLSRALSDAIGKQQIIDDNAPSEPLLVRIVGVTSTSSTCSPDEENPEGAYAGTLVGCAYSCPAVLTTLEGSILVDVDLFRESCTSTLVSQCVTIYSDAGTN